MIAFSFQAQAAVKWYDPRYKTQERYELQLWICGIFAKKLAEVQVVKVNPNYTNITATILFGPICDHRRDNLKSVEEAKEWVVEQVKPRFVEEGGQLL